MGPGDHDASRGSGARANAQAELALIIHQRLAQPELEQWFSDAQEQQLDQAEQANLFEMRREWQQSIVLPEDLVKKKAIAGSRCEHAWQTQRHANDWEGFKPNLTQVVELTREEAQIRSEQLGVSPYDSLIDLYEPGMNSQQIETLFSPLREKLHH